MSEPSNIKAMPQPDQDSELDPRPQRPGPPSGEQIQKALEKYRKEIPDNKVAIQHQFQEAIGVQNSARQNIAALIQDEATKLAQKGTGQREINAAKNSITSLEKHLKFHTENLTHLCSAYADFAEAETLLETS